ncbi:MAG: hypothetical protein KUG71_00815, partial [Porticoccaceae bacterium]|nr:hypothetical protein [Porticoccaceae bacterium]
MFIVRPVLVFLLLCICPQAYTWASPVEAQEVIWRPIAQEDVYLDGKELSYLSEELNLAAGGVEDGTWLKLLPGEEIPVLVPASHWLDVIGLSSSLSESVALQASESPGLFYAISGQYVSDSHLVIRPSGSSRFVVIRNVLGSTQGIRLQLGASPISKPPLLSYKAPDTHLGNGFARLTRQPDARKLALVRLEADSINRYKINGPALLTINSLAPGSSVGPDQLVWNIKAQLNGKVIAAWGHRDTVDNRQYYQFSDQEFWATTPKQYYLQIPSGEHVLSLRPDKAIWVSVGDNSSNFLFANNQAFLPPYVQGALDLDRQVNLQFAYTLLNKRAWIKSTGSIVNRLRSELGDNQAGKAIDDLGGRFYRATYPNSSAGLKAVNLDSLPRQWRPRGDMKPRYVDTQEQNLLYPKRKSTLFFELSDKRDLTFKLPSERILPQVKIRIYNPKQLGETISVRGTQQPIELTLAPDRYGDWPWKYSSITVLPYLRALQDWQAPKHRDDSPQRQQPLRGTHSEMLLDIDDGTGELTFSSNADEPVYVALSVSAPIVPPIEEQQWLALFGGESKVSWLRGGTSSITEDFRDEVTELRELLSLRDEQFKKGLNSQGEFPNGKAADHQWLTQAKALQAASRDGKLAEFVFIEQNGSSLELWKWRLDLLRKNSLWGTYLRFLKGLSAQATNTVVQHYAQQELTEYLTDTENDLAMEALTGHLVLATLNSERLYTFAEQRFNAGDYQSTLRSLALLPQTDQSAQLGLWTAVQLKQWRLYEHLLNFVEAENRDFYMGLQALFAGDIEAL